MGRKTSRGHRSGGSARGYQRSDRLNELLVRILASEIDRIGDDRLGLVTVAGVETDQDLSIARVFLTSDIDDEELLKVMAEHRPRLQRAIGDQARLRRVPPLTFVIDETARSADRIEEILRGLAPSGGED
ncbi:MAG: 30S ribosome-binding factor RbfA [Acidimicrobiales bacterium]|jgi:ribosome-binding factor A|nr:30S ribosome-binding factor RbfA [Acidimicrobiales bacterium]